MFARPCRPAADRRAMMTAHEVESRHYYDQCQAAENAFLQYADLSLEAFRSLVSLANRIALVDPIRPKIVRNKEDFHVGEAHGAQRIVGGLDIGAVAPRATPAIQNDELVLRQGFHPLPQGLQTCLTGGWANVFRVGNMRLRVKDVGAHLNHERS